MTTATPTRLGETNQAGSAYTGLFLEVFGGEVMGIYQDATVDMNRHVVRNITSGKSAQFPAYGRVAAGYHTVGVELLGQIPIVQSIREAADAGRPGVLQLSTEISNSFSNISIALK